MERRKYVGIACVVCLAALLFMGCRSREQEPAPDNSGGEGKIRIGMAFDTFILERWIRDRDVFVSTAEKLGAEVDVQSANSDVEKQKEQIEKFIDDNVDVIVVIAVDSYGLVEVVERARNEGILVISYDRLIQGTATDLFITVDSELVGKEMAQAIKEKLGGSGEIVMICGPEMDANSTDMVRGFEAEIQGSGLSVASKTFADAWTPEYGFQAVNEAFRNVEHIDAVMCGNDGLAGYAIKALSEQQLAGSVVVVGQDADVEACQRIVEGTQTMTVYKPIAQLAKTAAEKAVEYARERELEGVSDVRLTENGLEVPFLGLAPIAVTAENMDEVIIESGFHREEEVYLNVEGRP